MLKVYNQKQSIIQSLIQNEKITIVIDGTKDKVDLPKHLRNMLQVKLSLSPKSIIRFEDECLKVSLSFNKKPYDCVIPLQAIYYVSKQGGELDGYPFLEDMPEIFLQLALAMEEMELSDDNKANEISFETAKAEITKTKKD